MYRVLVPFQNYFSKKTFALPELKCAVTEIFVYHSKPLAEFQHQINGLGIKLIDILLLFAKIF